MPPTLITQTVILALASDNSSNMRGLAFGGHLFSLSKKCFRLEWSALSTSDAHF